MHVRKWYQVVPKNNVKWYNILLKKGHPIKNYHQYFSAPARTQWYNIYLKRACPIRNYHQYCSQLVTCDILGIKVLGSAVAIFSMCSVLCDNASHDQSHPSSFSRTEQPQPAKWWSIHGCNKEIFFATSIITCAIFYNCVHMSTKGSMEESNTQVVHIINWSQ